MRIPAISPIKIAHIRKYDPSVKLEEQIDDVYSPRPIGETLADVQELRERLESRLHSHRHVKASTKPEN